MEVIKERRGRVAAGEHRTRPVTVRMRTVPIVSGEARERAEAALWGALALALIAAAGAVEGSTWPM